MASSRLLKDFSSVSQFNLHLTHFVNKSFQTTFYICDRVIRFATSPSLIAHIFYNRICAHNFPLQWTGEAQCQIPISILYTLFLSPWAPPCSVNSNFDVIGLWQKFLLKGVVVFRSLLTEMESFGACKLLV